jgi:hypothetical protein
LSVVPVVLLYKGREIRKRSPFMLDSTFDGGEGEERKNSYSNKGQGRTGEGPTSGNNEV